MWNGKCGGFIRGALPTLGGYADEYSDDLRIAVELSGGHPVLIPPGARLIIGDTGI